MSASAALAAPSTPAAPTTTNDASKGAAAAPTPAEIRKLKLNIDGQDVELPESEVIARAQRESASSKRFQEAAQMRKQAEDILKLAEDNPGEFLSKRKKNAREWAENYLLEELKLEQMSPEQKKALENEQKLREYEKEKKETKDRQDADEREKLTNHHRDRFDKLFVEALNKSGLPKTPYTIKRMAELQSTNVKKKLELSPDQLAKLVREDYIAEQKALFGATEGDQLLDLFGEDLVKKMSKAQIAKLKSKGVRTSASAPARDRENGGEKAMSWREYQLKNRGRLK